MTRVRMTLRRMISLAERTHNRRKNENGRKVQIAWNLRFRKNNVEKNCKVWYYRYVSLSIKPEPCSFGKTDTMILWRVSALSAEGVSESGSFRDLSGKRTERIVDRIIIHSFAHSLESRIVRLFFFALNCAGN